MLEKILSISGKPGLYRLVNRGNNMLIVENIETGKRIPAYARDRVMSLGDISIYNNEGDTTPLGDVLEMVKAHADGKTIDVKSLSDAELRALFAEIYPDFDKELVHTSDIRKLLSWYNLLVSNGITEFKDAEEAEDEAAEAAEAADAAATTDK